MPLGRRLNVAKIEIDLPEFQRMFKISNTMCEAPECDPDPAPAFSPYQTEWSFAYLCEKHFNQVQSLGSHMRLRWDKNLGEHMMELFLRHSYVHQNMKSGFAIEAGIAAREEVEREMKRIENDRASADRRDLRKQINAQQVKIGAADEDLLTARQRQAARVQNGAAPVGPKPRNCAALLAPRLIVGLPKEGQA